MSIEWEPGAVTLPERIQLTNEQMDTVIADLWQLGIHDNPFTMTPAGRHAWLSQDRGIALAVYAAIRHATSATVTLTQSFREWSRELGLPW